MIFNFKKSPEINGQQHESPEIEELIRQRNALLQKHPQLQVLQGELDNLLATTIDPLKRSEIIFMLISDKLVELTDVYRDLSQLTSQAFRQQ